MSCLAFAGIAVLVVLHAALLWDRVVQGRLSDPDVALRWLGGAALTLALLGLRRLGVPLLWGRQALVFWLLVLLLHVGVAVPEDPGLPATPMRLLFVLPASVAPVSLLLLLLVALIVRPALANPGMARPGRRAGDGIADRREVFLLALSPRAPPA